MTDGNSGSYIVDKEVSIEVKMVVLSKEVKDMFLIIIHLTTKI